MKLSRGNHINEAGGCLVEVASLLLARKIVHNGEVQPDWFAVEKTDAPRCIARSVVLATRCVNDLTDEDELWRLAPLLPQLLRARRCRDAEVEKRVTARVVIWAARSVLHLVDPRLRERCEAAIERAEKDLWEPSNEPCDNRHWEAGWNKAAMAALWCGDDALVANCLWSAISVVDDDDRPLWLSDLLDVQQKALAEEGELAWDPDAEYPPDDEVNAVVDSILASR